MRSILLPIVLALLLSYLLRPIVRGLARLKIPRPVGAAFIPIGLLALSVMESQLWRGCKLAGNDLASSSYPEIPHYQLHQGFILPQIKSKMSAPIIDMIRPAG